jgi:hypothetical protein
MSKSLKELKTLIEKDLELQKHYIETFKKDENPQIKELYLKSLERQETLEDVLLYIKGGCKNQFSRL